jgi:TM2 domain-containing membrane protein YozV
MNDRTLQQKIRENVLERLQRGSAPMRSRAYFIARAALASAISILVLALSAYVLSFIAFSIHESGEQFLLGFGVRGIQTFFSLFPWLTAFLDIVLILALEWLLQSFKFGYRFSLLVLFGAVALASALVASAIALTPLHGALLGLADKNDLPLIGDMYEGVRDSHQDQGIFRGTVAAVHGNEITITHDDGDHDADDGTRTVVLPAGSPNFTLGDRAYVLGAASGTQVEAYGAAQLSPNQ